jgi:hypothetical protein
MQVLGVQFCRFRGGVVQIAERVERDPGRPKQGENVFSVLVFPQYDTKTAAAISTTLNAG